MSYLWCEYQYMEIHYLHKDEVEMSLSPHYLRNGIYIVMMWYPDTGPRCMHIFLYILNQGPNAVHDVTSGSVCVYI